MKQLPWFIRFVVVKNSVIFALIFSFIFGAAFTLAAVAMFNEYQNQSALSQDGAEVRGTVLDKYTETSTDDDGNTSTSYYIEYSYDAGFGDPPDVRQDSQAVSSGFYNRQGIGEPIAVTFLPDRREISRVEEDNAILVGVFFFGLVGLGADYLFIINVLASIFGWRRR